MPRLLAKQMFNPIGHVKHNEKTIVGAGTPAIGGRGKIRLNADSYS